MGKNEDNFSKIRSFFWPVHRYELRKFIPMLFLFFFITLNYHFLRDLKDALIVPSAGAAVVPFIQVWIMLPAAILMTSFFTWLTNWFDRENIFYIMMGIFLAFFILFMTVFYPHQEELHLHTWAKEMQGHLPKGAHGFITMIEYWVFTLFFVLAEGWSVMVFSVMMWGFANDVTSVAESKRFYPLFGIGINFSGVIAGIGGRYCIDPAKHGSSEGPFYVLMVAVILIGLLVIGIYRWLHVKIFTHQHYPFLRQEKANRKKDKASKMSLLNSLRYIRNSRYLISMTIIVLSYNILINLSELLWKAQLQELYPNKNQYLSYMFSITLITGILATLSSWFISGNIIRHLGWRFAALVTPMVMFITSIGFFYFIFLKQNGFHTSKLTMAIQYSPLALAVFWGSLQNCLTRAAKYTVFDETKEIAFIPLSAEGRIKGKSAIDGIGSRLGKSGGSVIMQSLMMFFNCSSIAALTMPIFMVFLGIISIWTYSITYLNKKFQKISCASVSPAVKEVALINTR